MSLLEIFLLTFGIGLLGGLSIPVFDGRRIMWGAWHAAYLLWKERR